MVRNIMLMKVTDEGARDIKKAPERIQAGIKAFEAMGGKVLGFWATMGEYDYVAVGEAPNDEVSLAFVVGLSAQGTVRTVTCRAYTPEEFAACVQKMPG
jgi:uncharacterized protein with GYD domain